MTVTLTGAPSGSANSSDSAAGCQKRRKYSPIGVPAPVRVNRSLSSAVSIALSLRAVGR